MKKTLAIAVAAVMVAGITQAATLDWQWKGKSSDKGSTVYLVLTDSKITELTSLEDLTDNYTIPASGGSGVVANKVSYWGATGKAVDPAITKTSANYVFVVVNEDKSGFWCSDVIDGTSKVYDPGNQETSPGSQSLNAGTISYSDWTVVPEPCSVALIALGLAAFGLKRKVA